MKSVAPVELFSDKEITRPLTKINKGSLPCKNTKATTKKTRRL